MVVVYKTFIIIITLIVIVYGNLILDNLYTINTNGITIIGSKLQTIFEKKPYVAFWKISYAEAPVGALRFKVPTLIYTFNKPHCNYSAYYNESCSSGFTEDCLYLSIYMPIQNTMSSFPVIVWIHDNSHKHGPDFLIEEDVIVITVSFRTSIFGFLNTEDAFAEGNMGAKDIIAALKWIRGNICYFNGDMNKVTDFGSDRTASVVASLPLSPAGDDLFKRVIIQDNSALLPGIHRNYNFEILNKLYRKLKGPFKKINRTELYSLLSEISAKELVEASQNLFDSTEVRDSQRLINDFGPTVEVSGKDPFMNKHPLDVYEQKITNNDVEVMIGYTNLDSLHKLDGFISNRKLLKYLNYNFQYLLPFEGRWDEYGSKEYKIIKRKIMDFYFINGTLSERSLRRYAKYLSDQVIYPVLRQARLHSQLSCNHVYLYRFTFKGSFNIVWNTLFRNLELRGATAGDEICYQFKCKSLNDAYNTALSNERFFNRKMARLLANFVKFGKPTPDTFDNVLGNLRWDPLTSHRSMRALNMASEMKMVNIPEEKRVKFWDQLRNDFFCDTKFHDEL